MILFFGLKVKSLFDGELNPPTYALEMFYTEPKNLNESFLANTFCLTLNEIGCKYVKYCPLK